MKKRYTVFLVCCCILNIAFAQDTIIKSPNGNIIINITNNKTLSYSVTYNKAEIIKQSKLGFQFNNEPDLDQGFEILDVLSATVNETWEPVVKSKHAKVLDYYNETVLKLKEKNGLMRRLDIELRAYNDGVAFRYKLFSSEAIGNREITKELTTFSIPDNPNVWMANYGKYTTHQQAEFFQDSLSSIKQESIIGLPLLVEYNSNCWVAITEANIDNYAGFYIGTTGASNNLTTKLSPLPKEKEDGVKVRFSSDLYSPWRVIMIGDNPGVLIESEIIQNLNEPCAIEDTSWIKPGMSSWDNWYSGNVKMEMPIIKAYIDLASNMNWPYMLVDWQWYGKYNTPNADISKSASQLNMNELVNYAKKKNVRLFLWLHSKDVNRNSAYKKAFPLYKKWGIAGVKIDFMNRDDQDMVNWYHDIIKCAAKNELLVNFHGAYKPDGIIRTYPNMITREGVMGNELNKFSKKHFLSSEHSVKLAFTRMLAGQMDYTPGGFLNVTKENYSKRVPTVVMSTRAGELAKFIVYESPLTVACDHPDNYYNQSGEDFLKQVKTTWDDTKFIEGEPESHIAIARKHNKNWYVGVLNNSHSKTINLDLGFLENKNYEIEIWADSKKSNTHPKTLIHRIQVLKRDKPFTVYLAKNGGFTAIIKPVNKLNGN